ncbi:dihydroxyacetone kinase [Nocardioides baekrokdamisoli]|uniref:Dihydroxyacetone kinase n=1 Tax=Nocardioides baekrokdamisoli TaxID=1804624 RepID=A0A3G9IGQ0_9ACTN|nr:DAK2 domain-containing protein [Nocardioides baekrokdamisoli]BBH18187.1 dihydroxyacetone kinase [Nocardioides baekrokdamisoli]
MIDADLFLRFADLAVQGLAEAREEINGLNVFPVPDADTGTNMYLTMTAARDAAYAVDRTDLVAVARALATGALTGARGNSGVITAQIMGAVVRHIADASPADAYAGVVATALNSAAEAAYAAVGDPQEGTMLTVWREAARAGAATATGPGVHTADVVAAAVVAAREALLHTPEQLEVLRTAGVVDAGGRGACVVLEAAEQALTGRKREPVRFRVARPVAAQDEPTSGPAYEVMYLLDAGDDAIGPLKTALTPLGDSLVVVGAEGLWNVHVHVDDAGAAIEAGMAAGRPHRIKITHFGPQQVAPVRQGRAVVAVSVGAGLTELMRESGATVLEGRGQSSANILAAIRATGAAEVILLPNDEDSLANAEIAASAAEIDDEIKVAVIPTRSQVQGLAALAVHDPQRSFDKDVLAVATTASQVRRGGVTIATLKAFTSAGPCEVGDVLGAIGGDFVVVGSDLVAIAIEVVGRLVGGGGELVTLVTGAKDPEGTLAAAVTTWLAETHPAIEAITYDGGQERYPLLIAVE